MYGYARYGTRTCKAVLLMQGKQVAGKDDKDRYRVLAYRCRVNNEVG
eukprot:COSAG02_NODE_474_length_21578_cov_225.787746_24_plen_47_part_00